MSIIEICLIIITTFITIVSLFATSFFLFCFFILKNINAKATKAEEIIKGYTKDPFRLVKRLIKMRDLDER